MNKKRKYAVYIHMSTWSGGVHLLGVYQWQWVAVLRAWWHVRVQSEYRDASIAPIRTDAIAPAYFSNTKAWETEMKYLSLD